MRENWVEMIAKYILKAVAVFVAWWINIIVLSIQSAMKGGVIFSRNFLAYLADTGKIDPKYKIDEKSGDIKDSYLDEVVGWSFAVLGILF